jgi:SulP family sulfate permease
MAHRKAFSFQRLRPVDRLRLTPGDVWGGLASMLVAFPASIAFGVTVYGAIAPSHAAYGALAGIVGVVVLGLVAPWLGGTERLISAPCAPAAAVLSAFAIQAVQRGDSPDLIVLMLVVIGMLAGLIQAGLGLIGIGGLIKYIPYPVVSGYLTGVGLIIIGSQIPRLLGAPEALRWWEALRDAATWDWRALAIGVTTVLVATGSQRATKKVPGIILGILAGLLAYGLLALFDRSLRVLPGNGLVIGSLAIAGDGFLSLLVTRWSGISRVGFELIAGMFGVALTLAALLSIDTLKTCVVLDQLTRTRHEPNRELVGQGIANMVSNALGGLSGAGQMGATLVGLNSGSDSRMAGVMEGVFALAAALIVQRVFLLDSRRDACRHPCGDRFSHDRPRAAPVPALARDRARLRRRHHGGGGGIDQQPHCRFSRRSGSGHGSVRSGADRKHRRAPQDAAAAVAVELAPARGRTGHS